jgi:hypothetical protein
MIDVPDAAVSGRWTSDDLTGGIATLANDACDPKTA